jgi:hypothetical protein
VGQGFTAQVTALQTDNTCAACGTGTFSAADDANACATLTASCGVGQGFTAQVTALQTDNTCAACGTGTFSAADDANACGDHTVTTCIAGQGLTTAPSATADGACTACGAGFFSGATDANACAACPTTCGVGTFAPALAEDAVAGASACTDHTVSTCPAGSALTAPTPAADGSCVACEGTQWSDEGAACDDWTNVDAAACTAAETLGQFAAGTASKDSACAVCADGSTVNTADTTACVACSGTQWSVGGAACGPWTNVNAAACTDGSEWTTGTASTDSTCTPCVTGKFSSGGAACAACTAGSTNTGTGNTACAVVACVAGSVLNADGDGCTQCAAGKFSDDPDIACKNCGAGTFAAAAGTAKCAACSNEACDAGQEVKATCAPGYAYATCTATADASCTACAAGKFSAEGLTCATCADCGEGEERVCGPISDSVCMVVKAAITVSHDFKMVADKAPSQADITAALAAQNPDAAITEVKVTSDHTVGVTATTCPTDAVCAAMAETFRLGLVAEGAHSSITAACGTGTLACVAVLGRRRRLEGVALSFVITATDENADISEHLAAVPLGESFIAAVIAAAQPDGSIGAEDQAMLNDVAVDVSDVSVTSTVTYKIQVPTAAAAKILETQLADTAATEAMLTAVAKEAGITATSVTLGDVTSVDAFGSLDWKLTCCVPLPGAPPVVLVQSAQQAGYDAATRLKVFGTFVVGNDNTAPTMLWTVRTPSGLEM